MVFCTKCGGSIHDSAPNCPHCKHPQFTQGDHPCLDCGGLIDGASLSCPHCKCALPFVKKRGRKVCRECGAIASSGWIKCRSCGVVHPTMSKNEYKYFNVAKYCLIAIVAIVLIKCAFGGGSEGGKSAPPGIGPTKNTASPQVKEASPSNKVSDSALTPYTKDLYPKLFAQFAERMPDVERAKVASVYLAASSDKCARVWGVDVSSQSTKNNIKTFVDCDKPNGESGSERFRFSESELKDQNGKFFTKNTVPSASKAKTMGEKGISEDDAVMACREMTRVSAKFPSSVNFSTLNTLAGKSSGSGETWVNLELTAKNESGVDLPYKSECRFPIDGAPKVDVYRR